MPMNPVERTSGSATGSTGDHDGEKVAAGCLPPWDVGELPPGPRFEFAPARIIGPGLMMAGAAIGGGEWLMGPAVTAQYGGSIMWVATLSILFQAVYNVEVMRYAIYCGEPIFVGFFRTQPGPRFWIICYLLLDFGAIWPYLSANAAVPLVAAYFGDTPIDPLLKAHYVQQTGIWIFIAAFIPLIFGGKIYNSLEKVMVAKIVLVLGYLTFLGIFYVDWATWSEVFTGFVSFGALPIVNGHQITWTELIRAQFGSGGEPVPLDLALIAAFAAIAGTGGLTNTMFSNYAREKGWGMGSQVGAIPSAVGGKGIALSHNGRVFKVNDESQKNFRAWRNVTLRDQFGIWVIGCILGMGIPSLVSLQFVRGQAVNPDNVAAMTAEGLRDATGAPILYFLTLFCGFIVLAPSQVATIDGIVRRWTDLIWTGNSFVRRLDKDKVVYVYYGMMLAYMAWGLFVLTMIDKPLVLVKMSALLLNYALGLSTFHTLAVNWFLLPKELRPSWLMRILMIGCAIFFVGIAALGTPQALRDIGWLPAVDTVAAASA